jgi:RHS repeat-associated protein
MIGLPLSLSQSLAWNCYGALKSSQSDLNGNETSFSCDNMNRLIETSYPDGGLRKVQYTSATVTDYCSLISGSVGSFCSPGSGSLARQDETDVDGLGRPIDQVLVSDPSGETYAATTYDSLGRLYTRTNPYRSTSDPTYGKDTYSYDALNRITEIAHTDGSGSQISYGSGTQLCSTSTYGYGYPALYTDESGNQRRTFTDPLGRVIEVDEPDPSNGNTLTLNTCYAYDALGDLTSVVQGSETRTYSYDGLGRKTAETTPEGGTTYYYYTTSGGGLCANSTKLVCRKTDARGITTTYSYDALERLTSKSYSNNNPSATAYTYDQTSCLGLSVSCYNKGRRTTMTDASGSTEWAYDAMGRVLIEHRTIGSVTNSIEYTYNLDGSAETITYPSGRTITYTVSAAERPLSAVDTANSINYALDATYAPQGALAGALLGESGSFGGITYAATYTNRMLPYTLTASSSAGNALNLTFAWYANASVETIANNLNTARTQSFTYDKLNRISTAQSQATSGTYCWGQSFGYDRYGNLETATVTQCTAPALSLSVNANNQITNSGFTYDASGDLTSDGTYTYAWDARPRLQSAAGVTYTYDGNDKRVAKSSGTLYWNGVRGPALAETNASGSTLNEYIFFAGRRIARRDSSGNVYYYFSDHLGTSKTLTTSAGVLCYDADFLPFGYEMAYVTSCVQNYKFTGLERDGETGLDHTLHRKYESSLGRWLNPDPAGPAAANPANPQSWNRYAYVGNRPTVLTDALGLLSASNACLYVRARPMSSGAMSDCGYGPGPGPGGVSIDGGAPIPVGEFGSGSLGGGESAVQCPDNVCSGLGTDDNGETAFVEFIATAGGVSGYYNPEDLADGIYEYGGQLYNSDNYQSLLEQQYDAQIAAQCGSVNDALAANNISATATCSGSFVQGGHANFTLVCDDDSQDCLAAGRYDDGLHIEFNSSTGLYYAHDDTASPYIGSSFNWATFNPWNLLVHGVVDVIGGNIAVYVFPH